MSRCKNTIVFRNFINITVSTGGSIVTIEDWKDGKCHKRAKLELDDFYLVSLVRELRKAVNRRRKAMMEAIVDMDRAGSHNEF